MTPCRQTWPDEDTQEDRCRDPRCAARCGAGALCLTATTTAAIVPAAADAAEVGVGAEAIEHPGRQPRDRQGPRRPAPGAPRALQIQRRGRWVTIDRDRTNARGRFVLRDRVRGPLSARARVRLDTGETRSLGPAERLPPRARVVVRPGPVRQQARLRRHAAAPARSASPTSRCRAARRSRSATAAASCASAVIDRGPYVGGARVRPDRRDRAQARLQRPRADPGHALSDERHVRPGPLVPSCDGWPRSA